MLRVGGNTWGGAETKQRSKWRGPSTGGGDSKVTGKGQAGETHGRALAREGLRAPQGPAPGAAPLLVDTSHSRSSTQ